MRDILTLAGALLGSGAVAALVTFFLNTKKDQVFFMRKKTEELYLAFEGFDRSLGSHFIGGYPLLKGEISWNDFNDLNIKNADKRDIDASQQVLMLIDIYFPNVKADFNKYLEQRAKLLQILNEHKKAYKDGDDGDQFLDPFHKAMNEFARRSKEVKHAVIAEAHKFASADQLWLWNRS